MTADEGDYRPRAPQQVSGPGNRNVRDPHHLAAADHRRGRAHLQELVIARVISAMTEFKQIIGRGTQVRDDYGKLWFNILDYTGSATRLFADPDFDGETALVSERRLIEQQK